MSVGEDSTPGGEPVHVGCLDLWVATKETNPVVQVIYSDEEDVRQLGVLFAADRRWAAQERSQGGEK